jgi:hypothetical protein
MSDQCANFEFFATCRERLTDSGVLVVNFTGDDPGLPFHVQKLEAVFGISYALVSCNGGGELCQLRLEGCASITVEASVADTCVVHELGKRSPFIRNG